MKRSMGDRPILIWKVPVEKGIPFPSRSFLKGGIGEGEGLSHVVESIEIRCGEEISMMFFLVAFNLR